MDAIATHARSRPEALALVEGGRRLTWASYLDLRNRLAAALLAGGLGRGEHVIVYGQNSVETVAVPAAVRAAGAVAVPMNHRLTPEEIAYILDHSDATTVFVGESFLPRVEAVREGAGKVRRWIVMGEANPPWASTVADLVAEGDPASLPPDAGQGLGGSMIYTGGTTGKPKGAFRRGLDPQLTLAFMQALGMVHPDHVHLVAGPLYHSAPGSFALFAHLLGGTVVVMPRFDPEQALHLIDEYRVTSTFMAPTLVKRIVDLPEAVQRRYDVSSMRSLVVAGAPCPTRVKEQAAALFGPSLYEFYGSTELGINTILRPEDVLRKPGSCGRPAPGLDLVILGDDGEPVAPGTPGELFIRRYVNMFDGYYKDPRATEDTRRGDLHSVGDVAYVDEEGFFYICDRKRDMIISGGVNIYPAEIEDVLHRHPEVEDVAVFGVPDDDWGERVHAAVHVRPGRALTADEVIRFAREHLADYKVPREVSFHADFPRDSAGKLLKRVLREPHWAGRRLRI